MPAQADSLWYMLSTLIFILFILFSNRIQVYIWLQEIARALRKLERMVHDSRRMLLEVMEAYGGDRAILERRVNELLEFFVIEPVDRDPFGVIRRLEHLIESQRVKLRGLVRRLAPKADGIKLRNLENMLEASIALYTLYRLTRHYTILGKKTRSIFLIMQVEMMLPLIMRYAEAYYNALRAFRDGLPIGDSIGPMVAGRLMLSASRKEVEEDTVIAEVPFEGRTLYVIKALGPGGEVGRPGLVLERLVERLGGRVSRIIMVDAALKLEGERSGDVVEGVGAAIGDPGPEKMRIEEVAARYRIPIDAIIIKESLEEAIMPMKREIAEAVDRVIERIYEIVRERVPEGGIVIVAGIGNTVGVGQ